ncbi:MAG: DUF983 domain-containing protein [Alphaproteobacteria bacterium]|jgi:uncharacterized protein (DUF983 family)|nr:DUF983 domain-containing protein [Alphaproteobacteria bacterium]MBT7942317.1 DUF983 domain-containing protein [Alphaproteobacteria bacterium]
MTKKPILRSISRGLRKRCPKCGQGEIYKRYIKPVECCNACGEALGHIRTDDFAPWLTIIILGHFLVPAAYAFERIILPPLWVHAVLWGPLIILLVLGLLPYTKGVCLGFMWALGLSGDEKQ